MKNKKLIAIIITVALTFTACQSSKANIGASTEVSGDSTSVTETTVSTSSVETSVASTDESNNEILSEKDKRRKELFLETPIGEVREVNGALQEKSIAICEEKMNHRELLGKILAEVRKVNEQWYEILMLLCVEQCTYEETAQRLGISVMVLRARLYRARSYVRKHYGAEYRES